MDIVQLNIQGMTCAACVAHVEKAIKKVDGVDMASVNLATEKATVSLNPEQAEIENIIRSVSDAGYSASVAGNTLDDEQSQQKARELKELKLRLTVAVILSAPLLLAMFAGLLHLKFLMFLHNPYLQFILATPVQFWIGWRFFRGAWKNLKALSPGMDVLVALGTSAAYIFSIFNGFIAEHLGIKSSGLYFEASAIIITLVLLGKYLEANARGKTSEAIKRLMGLQPKTASVERNGELCEIPIDDVAVGDIIHIKPGDRIPVDGVITEGNTAVDESTITGESMPVEKAPGDKLVSGTINSYGSVKFCAEHVGSDSVLSRIIKVVEEAQGSKAPIQKLADRVAAIFVPVVLGIALLTFCLWWLVAGSFSAAIIAAVAVLVIACPCSLGLATPTAIMVGTGIGAERGILIKNGEVLQQAGKITAVVLDKTGTITMGRPELQKIDTLNIITPAISDTEILTLAASLENSSEHPLARAIVNAAKQQNCELQKIEDFTSVAGKGISAKIDNKTYLIGTESYLEENGIDTAILLNKKTELEEAGNTVVILANTTQALALLAIADSIKDTSRSGIATLQAMGLEVYMLTGDNKRTANAIAANAGINNVIAEILPEGKAEEVKRLQKAGHVVAMVGDGINDAPALASADTGIAMGEGSDIAMESADITLMRGDLREIAAAIQLSRRTMAKIRQNLFWAFFYNSIGIPVAASGLLNPIIAGAAMAFSSVSVVTNSLRLKNFKLQEYPQANTISQTDIKAESPLKEKTMTTTITVEGMSCNHCKMAVEKAAGAVAGVTGAAVDLDKKELTVNFADGQENIEEVKKAVTEAGYTTN